MIKRKYVETYKAVICFNNDFCYFYMPNQKNF